MPVPDGVGPNETFTFNPKGDENLKEITYYQSKKNATEMYNEMELTDYMNILKHQDLVPAGRQVCELQCERHIFPELSLKILYFNVELPLINGDFLLKNPDYFANEGVIR